MKPLHKVLIISLTLLLLCAVGVIIHQDARKSQQDESFAQLISNQGENSIIEKYTRDSVVHTVFQDRLINNDSNEKRIALGKTFADSLEKALKMSVDKIDQVTKVNARLEAQMALLTKSTDKGPLKYHQDKNLNLVYNPQNDSLKFAYNLELIDARYSEKKWLLGAKKNYIDIYSNDPRITVNGAKTYRIKEDPPNRFGLGLQTGYGLGKDGNVIRLMPYVGIGLNYNLIEF